MVIIVTDEGIEVDGLLLKSSAEMQTFIGAHAPKDLPVGIGAHAPVDLIALLRPSPNWPTYEFYANIFVNRPSDLNIEIKPITPYDLTASIGITHPLELETVINPIPYKQLNVVIDWIVHHETLPVYLGGHPPHDLEIRLSMLSVADFTAVLNSIPPRDLHVLIKIYQRSNYDLRIDTAAVHSSYHDLLYYMYVWGARDLAVNIGTSIHWDLSASIWGWHPHDVDVYVKTVYPTPIEVTFNAEPEPGQDLLVIHRIHQKIPLQIDLNVWTGLKTLDVSLYGLYAHDLDVELKMGSYRNLEVPLPMTTGYRDLFITLKPATRIMSTIITVYTMEVKDLYISINQGWPCGFGSSYKLLEVSFIPAFFLNFSAYFKVIYGSGYKSMATYINRAYFDTFIGVQNLTISLPSSAIPADATIIDKVDLLYENTFDDIVQDIIQVRFPWPRFRKAYGDLNFTVELFPFHGNTYLDFIVEIYAVKPDPPRMPESKPLVVRQGLDEPVWPDVFQVKEIELWSEDSSEIVRRIEVMFGEQIREYYWVSKDQRAYSKNVWEDKWTFLTRGYLPHTEYSGQIDYVTLREISEMKNYDTVDQAMKALLANFLYHGKADMEISLAVIGTYSNLPVTIDIRGRDRIYNLWVRLEPMKTNDLSITLTCV
jgi:hypothetical protein